MRCADLSRSIPSKLNIPIAFGFKERMLFLVSIAIRQFYTRIRLCRVRWHEAECRIRVPRKRVIYFFKLHKDANFNCRVYGKGVHWVPK